MRRGINEDLVKLLQICQGPHAGVIKQQRGIGKKAALPEVFGRLIDEGWIEFRESGH